MRSSCVSFLSRARLCRAPGPRVLAPSPARSNYSALLTIHEETWSGDRLAFNLSALGQSAVGFIDVADDHVRLEVQLPWLLAVMAEKLTPAIRKEGTLMLEKK